MQYQQLQSQFEELKGDFQYNLQLLAERDAELEQADTSASSAIAELAAKANTITQLQSQLAQAQSGALCRQPLAPCMRQCLPLKPADTVSTT
jgi:chromosome segregation ATPase